MKPRWISARQSRKSKESISQNFQEKKDSMQILRRVNCLHNCLPFVKSKSDLLDLKPAILIMLHAPTKFPLSDTIKPSETTHGIQCGQRHVEMWLCKILTSQIQIPKRTCAGSAICCDLMENRRARYTCNHSQKHFSDAITRRALFLRWSIRQGATWKERY